MQKLIYNRHISHGKNRNVFSVPNQSYRLFIMMNAKTSLML